MITLDRIMLGGLLLAIVVAPWPFGSVEFYAIDFLGALVVALIGFWAMKGVLERKVEIFLTPMHGVLMAILAFALIQLVPWPMEIHHNLFRSHRMSLDPSATRAAILKLGMLIGYFFIATQLLHSHRRLSAMVHTLIIVGFVVAVIGILNKLTFNGRLLWFRESDVALGAFGPFVNRNHFAGFIELLFPLPLMLILGRVVERDKWVFYGFITITMGTALVLSASRGGIMSLMIQLISLPILAQQVWTRSKTRNRPPLTPFATVQLVPVPKGGELENHSQLAQTQRDLWRVIGGTMALAVCITIGVVWIGVEPVVSRLSLADQTQQSRPIVQQRRPATWWNTVKMIRAHPFVGIGLGAYPTVYPHYDDSSGYFLVDAAHNDYLQVFADMGLVGGILGAIFLVLLLRLIVTALSSHNRLERAVGLGSTIGCIGVLAHSLVDFNLQITANALIFLMLVALLDSVQWRSVRAEKAELIYTPE